MKARSNYPVLAGLGLVMALGVFGPSTALSKTKVLGPCSPAAGVVRHEWRFQNPTCGPIQTLCRFNNVPGTNGIAGCGFESRNILFRMQQGSRGVMDCNSVAEPACAGRPLDVVAQIAGWDALGRKYARDLVNAHNGGALANGSLATSAVGDTAFAEDSMAVSIGGVGTTVTLSDFSGFLKHDSGTSGSKSSLTSTYIVAVYPSAAAMNADPNNTGAGSNFYGKVVFNQSKVLVYPPGQIGGGFSSGDFTISIGPNGTNIVRPVAGLTKNVTVPSAATAATALIVDPVIAGDAVVPVASPIAMGIICLLLLGSGFWVVARRARRA